MDTSMIENNISQTFISDFAVLIKKMRLLRRLSRQQAALLLDISFKYIERLENGRGDITLEKFKEFQNKYGFSDNEVEDLIRGKGNDSSSLTEISKKNASNKRRDRRFCHRRITRECKVLKEMRLQKDLDQYSASKLCGFGDKRMGFIENGRVSLTDKKLRHIVESYSFTMEYFYQLLKLPQLRHEMVEDCQTYIESLDENKLRIIQPMLQSMSIN